jgi:hypothetical protein
VEVLGMLACYRKVLGTLGFLAPLAFQELEPLEFEELVDIPIETLACLIQSDIRDSHQNQGQ